MIREEELTFPDVVMAPKHCVDLNYELIIVIVLRESFAVSRKVGHGRIDLIVFTSLRLAEVPVIRL